MLKPVIQYKHLAPNQFSRPMSKLREVRGVVIHWTGNPQTNRHSNGRYFELLKNQDPNDDRPDRYASSHYLVDWEGVVEVIPPLEVAYHVGAHQYVEGIQDKVGSYPNNHLLGIEVCHLDMVGKFDKDTMEHLRDLVCWLFWRNSDLDIMKDLYRHYDITEKLCPKYYVEHPHKWNSMKKDFKRALDRRSQQYSNFTE